MSQPVPLAQRISNTPDEGGVWHLSHGELPGIEKTAAELGLCFVRVDLAGCAGKRILLERLAQALRFPDWFGHNWDALADCLDDLSWLPGTGLLVVLEHADDFAQQAPAEFTTAIEILREASQTHRERGMPLWVLLDSGPFPDADSPR